MNDHPFDPARVNTMLRATWGLHRPGDKDARLDLVLGPDEDHDLELEKRLREAIGGPGDPWELAYRWHKPVEPLQWGAPEPSDVPGIRDDLERRLSEAGIIGANDVQAFPTGWIWIAQVMVHRMCEWANEGETIRIQQIKEKFGGLRVYAYGSDRLGRLTDWCEEQSICRCMATGMEGELRQTGWLLTLSDAAYELCQRDRPAAERMMYPPREGADG
ncbi:hypothetical protein CLV79_10922 [Limimaricola soesokkakensis]|uniref:Uncharacterized protein n=1 Tax=Limimaricola soesokkakensis TaxID=1343159 RepID=A0A1X6ZSJ0_9RHOB|nr:hypothetical protein [Limimaricola soesokkakensis]PSK84050.1 hypothetical protein CLV79_10922 [Limimaricola soesokkakensis]SLN59803.1 hypothetical protein LOS8367_02876 [Limimaricola soesokkakensis]